MDILITKPYSFQEQTELILLKPEQMNSDIKLNLKMNLKEKLEGKCNKNGLIDTIYKIVNYSDGLITAENLSGGAIYNVKYECKMYNPLENISIIGEVVIVKNDLVAVKQGPIIIFITRDLISTENFDVNRGFLHHKTKQQLKVNQKVVVMIKDKKINPKDDLIRCMGYLVDIATEEQIKEYYVSGDSDDETEEEAKEESNSNKPLKDSSETKNEPESKEDTGNFIL